MAEDKTNLIWIDLEMTGLDPDRDEILEIATVVTDQELNVLAIGPVLAISQPESRLAAMDDWNRKHHSASGLLERVRAHGVSYQEAEAKTMEFLQRWVPVGVSPMCGNSVCQDRRFLYRCMPKLEAYFHYRNLDVSTLKELARRWAPKVQEGFKKKNAHQALADILESIEELKYYRSNFIRY
ncbi:MAG: oligoribonuclease [Methylohalobius sp.]|nr:oligoribonuclease [Methylohalobius sp.]